ncbi:MAG: DinB family protein [Gemmatimonadaceae bacterium]
MTARKAKSRKKGAIPLPPAAPADPAADPAPAAAAPAAPRDRRQPVDLGRALVEAFLTNERINQVLLDMVEPRVWRLFPPSSSRRNIATSFAHIHNVRCMRLKMSDTSAPPPERLERATITQDEARVSLGRSARAMRALIERSVAEGGHVHDYRPDVVAMVCAAITHEAHHRGQICHWLRELGAPLSPELQLRLWEWDKRWKEVARS